MRSVCHIEIERHAIPTLAPLLTREQVYPMALFDAKYDKQLDPNDYRRYIDEQSQAAIAMLVTLPEWVPRVVYVFGLAAWDLNDAFIARMNQDHPENRQLPPIDWARLDTSVPYSQMEGFRNALDQARIDALDGIYLDHEVMHPKGRRSAGDCFRSILSPISSTHKMLWNHAAESPGIPSRYWAGNFWRDLIDGTSCLEAYIGWYDPRNPSIAASASYMNSRDTLWANFIRFVNAARSAAACGPTVVHLPVCHPDPTTARHYTREIIIHCVLAGISRFNWASYMSDEQPAMADTINQALADADAILARTWLRYTSQVVGPNATSVQTRGYLTRKALLV